MPGAFPNWEAQGKEASTQQKTEADSGTCAIQRRFHPIYPYEGE